MFAQLQSPFAQRGVKLLALSVISGPESNEKWVEDVNSISLEPIRFPIINDREGALSHLFGVYVRFLWVQESSSEIPSNGTHDSLDERDVQSLKAGRGVTEGLAFKSRHIVIVGPELEGKHHVRLTLNYPDAVGFGTAEVLRVMDCLQTADHVRFDAQP